MDMTTQINGGKRYPEHTGSDSVWSVIISFIYNLKENDYTWILLLQNIFCNKDIIWLIRFLRKYFLHPVIHLLIVFSVLGIRNSKFLILYKLYND